MHRGCVDPDHELVSRALLGTFIPVSLPLCHVIATPQQSQVYLPQQPLRTAPS